MYRNSCSENHRMCKSLRIEAKVTISSNQSIPPRPISLGILPPDNSFQSLFQSLQIIPTSLAILILPTVKPHRLNPNPLTSLPIYFRPSRPLKIDHMRNILRVLVRRRSGYAPAVRTSICYGGNEIHACEWVRRWACLAVQCAVEDEDFASDVWRCDSIAYVS